jgi:hypothetical protein
MNKDEKAAFAERIKQEEALHEKLHQQMLSDSKAHDEAIAKSVADGSAADQAELALTASAKKGK